MKHIMKERFNDWLTFKEKARFDMEFVDMHNAKFTYTMLQCSAWSRLNKPFSSCDCCRGEAALDGNL